VCLSKIFRQAQQSGIVVNAHRVNAGTPPRLDGFADFLWFTCEDTEETARLTADIVARRIPRRFGMDPRRDIQMLAGTPARGAVADRHQPAAAPASALASPSGRCSPAPRGVLAADRGLPGPGCPGAEEPASGRLV
jgi:exodeoxyribonuclease V alpha subunit